MSSTSYSIPRFVRTAPWALSRGAAQVMFQDNPWTGLLFIIGIFAGSYIEGMPVVAWGALAGLVTSTLAGMFFRFPRHTRRLRTAHFPRTHHMDVDCTRDMRGAHHMGAHRHEQHTLPVAHKLIHISFRVLHMVLPARRA